MFPIFTKANRCYLWHRLQHGQSRVRLKAKLKSSRKLNKQFNQIKEQIINLSISKIWPLFLYPPLVDLYAYGVFHRVNLCNLRNLWIALNWFASGESYSWPLSYNPLLFGVMIFTYPAIFYTVISSDENAIAVPHEVDWLKQKIRG